MHSEALEQSQLKLSLRLKKPSCVPMLGKPAPSALAEHDAADAPPISHALLPSSPRELACSARRAVNHQGANPARKHIPRTPARPRARGRAGVVRHCCVARPCATGKVLLYAKNPSSFL